MQPDTMKVVAAALPKVWEELAKQEDAVGTTLMLCPHCESFCCSSAEFVYLNNSTKYQVEKISCPMCQTTSHVLVFTQDNPEEPQS